VIGGSAAIRSLGGIHLERNLKTGEDRKGAGGKKRGNLRKRSKLGRTEWVVKSSRTSERDSVPEKEFLDHYSSFVKRKKEKGV